MNSRGVAMILRVFGLALPFALGGCAAAGLSTSVGPSRTAIASATSKGVVDGIQIVDLNHDPAMLPHGRDVDSFADVFGQVRPAGEVVGIGDTLTVSIVEAPPAALFGTAPVMLGVQATVQGTETLPETLVGSSGQIFIPFAGQVRAAGRTNSQIEADIMRKLAGKAHLPQVSVRLSRNAAANVTVIGEVKEATRMPLTPKGERLLDALASAGGTTEPVGKMTIQVTRGDRVAAMPLEAVIRNPRDNIRLAADDVVTAIFQPYSFTVLGAASKSGEVQFEATGISLAQALGRVGGLQDQRADPKGVFLFRWEDARDLLKVVPSATRSAEGKVPVIYRINMKDPATYFLAQNFPIEDKDIIYVSNSSLADFQRFVSIIASTVLPVVAVTNSVK